MDFTVKLAIVLWILRENRTRRGNMMIKLTSTNTSARDLKGLKALSEEGIFKKFYLVSQDRMNRKHDVFHLVHWQTFLHELWDGQLV